MPARRRDHEIGPTWHFDGIHFIDELAGLSKRLIGIARTDRHDAVGFIHGHADVEADFGHPPDFVDLFSHGVAVDPPGPGSRQVHARVVRSNRCGIRKPRINALRTPAIAAELVILHVPRRDPEVCFHERTIDRNLGTQAGCAYGSKSVRVVGVMVLVLDNTEPTPQGICQLLVGHGTVQAGCHNHFDPFR